MIIATSGDSYINYNRIISSSNSPYLVSESKTLREPTPTSSLRLYGLYIIDQNNLVSLILHTSARSTQLATINFLTEKISF